MVMEHNEHEKRFNQLILEVMDMSYHQAEDRLREISQILGDPGISVDETTQLLRYSRHLADYCKSFLEPDTSLPLVIEQDKAGNPVGLRNLDLVED